MGYRVHALLSPSDNTGTCMRGEGLTFTSTLRYEDIPGELQDRVRSFLRDRIQQPPPE